MPKSQDNAAVASKNLVVSDEDGATQEMLDHYKKLDKKCEEVLTKIKKRRKNSK